mmetsp:Transcript_14768/g.44358  ORF Transcript_14768/g.44358 Transcript_14768/m.44358 type:complete len:268 (+) Transcript_14768:70-873(+)
MRAEANDTGPPPGEISTAAAAAPRLDAATQAVSVREPKSPGLAQLRPESTAGILVLHRFSARLGGERRGGIPRPASPPCGDEGDAKEPERLPRSRRSAACSVRCGGRRVGGLRRRHVGRLHAGRGRHGVPTRGVGGRRGRVRGARSHVAALLNGDWLRLGVRRGRGRVLLRHRRREGGGSLLGELSEGVLVGHAANAAGLRHSCRGLPLQLRALHGVVLLHGPVVHRVLLPLPLHLRLHLDLLLVRLLLVLVLLPRELVLNLLLLVL